MSSLNKFVEEMCSVFDESALEKSVFKISKNGIGIPEFVYRALFLQVNKIVNIKLNAQDARKYSTKIFNS